MILIEKIENGETILEIELESEIKNGSNKLNITKYAIFRSSLSHWIKT